LLFVNITQDIGQLRIKKYNQLMLDEGHLP